MTNLEIALLITGQGMLGIFAVMGLITVLVTLFTKFGKKYDLNNQQAAAANAATACFNIVDFAPRTAQIILIVICRDMRVTNYSLRGARVAAASRAARHEAQRIPLKRRHSRLFKYSKTRDSVPRF